jgi:hypothetical protein
METQLLLNVVAAMLPGIFVLIYQALLAMRL